MTVMTEHSGRAWAPAISVGALALLDPPEGDDPEMRLLHEESREQQQAIKVFALEQLGAHKYGSAFIAFVLHGKSWCELEEIHGVLAGTLRRTFHRAVQRLAANCRRRFMQEIDHG